MTGGTSDSATSPKKLGPAAGSNPGYFESLRHWLNDHQTRLTKYEALALEYVIAAAALRSIIVKLPKGGLWFTLDIAMFWAFLIPPAILAGLLRFSKQPVAYSIVVGLAGTLLAVKMGSVSLTLPLIAGTASLFALLLSRFSIEDKSGRLSPRRSSHRVPLAFHIFYRQLSELGHRRKLVVFLFLMPLLLMVLFGVSLGEEKVPWIHNPQQLDTIRQLRSDQNLVSLFTVLGAVTGDHPQPLKIVGTVFPSPSNVSSKAILYIVPSGQNTSVILVDKGSSSYYRVVLSNENFSVQAAEGPKSLPVSTHFDNMPEVDVRPLLSTDAVLKMARAGMAIFGIWLDIFLSPDRRLIDVLFPEILGLEIGWVGVLGSAVIAVEDRVSGARRRILMSPISRASVVLGSALANFVLIGLQLIVLFATAILVFKVSIAGSLVDLVPIIAAASFSVIGLGLIISHFSKTPDEAFYMSTLVNLPMGFLASQHIPLAKTPLSNLVQSLLPMTHADKAFTQIMVNGAALSTVLPQLLALTIFAVALFTLGTIMVMREK